VQAQAAATESTCSQWRRRRRLRCELSYSLTAGRLGTTWRTGRWSAANQTTCWVSSAWCVVTTSASELRISVGNCLGSVAVHHQKLSLRRALLSSSNVTALGWAGSLTSCWPVLISREVRLTNCPWWQLATNLPRPSVSLVGLTPVMTSQFVAGKGAEKRWQAAVNWAHNVTICSMA